MSEERPIEDLLRDAGPRTAIPEDDLAEIREAARAEWRERYGAPARRRWWIPVAAAASLAVVAFLAWRTLRPARTGVDLEAPRPMALALSGGASVRLDASSRARILSSDLIELLDGAVYIDTRGGRPVRVRTAAGLFQPNGTQFEVRVMDGSTRLKVREGSVALSRSDELVVARAGEEVVIRSGSIERHTIPSWGPEWEWVLASAPVPAIEGRKVRAFLDWIAREAGWKLELADPETANLVETVDLHGSVSHLSPMQALSVVLSSAGLESRISNGTLYVSVRTRG